MIHYGLRCEGAHAFDAWFRTSDDCDAQIERGAVNCPTCGSATVAKRPMAPALTRGEKAAADDTARLDDASGRELRAASAAARQEAIARTRDVGTAFAATARAMAEGRTAQEAIRGQATLREIHGLAADGIGVLCLPSAPETMN